MKRIGDILLESGKITSAELAEALSKQKDSDKKLGEIMVDMGLITEMDVLRALSMQYDIPIIDLANVEIDAAATKIVTQEYCQDNLAIPIGFEEDSLVVAIYDPLNILVTDDIQFRSGREVLPMLATRAALQNAIQTSYGKDVASKAAADLEQEMDLQAIQDLGEQIATDEVNQAPVVKLVNSMIEYAVRSKSSDIHIEPMADRVRVRIRIDGVLAEIMTNPLAARDAIITRVKILSGLNIAEKRIPQDGRIQITLGKDDVDMRVSVLPTVHGEKTVIRILAKNDANLNRDFLGINAYNNKLIDRMIQVPQGIVLVSGPTGSGKTTTLYTLLSEKNTPDTNIVTVEDPVEIQIPGINQVQVNVKAGMTFANGLRSILRQDPDIILVGEIRDGETAEIAMRAAITGHLVFSTIHTNDAISSINRLIDMGLEPFMVSTALTGVISQRLVRRICTNCRTEYEPDEAEIKLLNLKPGQTLYHGAGCSDCNGFGYKGRIAIHEIATMSKAIKALLNSGATEDQMRQKAIEEGMQLLSKSAETLVLEGITTVAEMSRVTYTID